MTHLKFFDVSMLAIWRRAWSGMFVLLFSAFVAQHGAAFAVLDLLVLLGIVFLLFSWNKSVSVFYAEMKWVALAVWVYVILSLVTVVWHGDYGRSHARLLYYVAFLPLIAIALFRLKIRVEYFWWAICLAAIVAGVYAVVEIHFYSVGRAGGSMGKPIVFGDVALTLGLLSLVSVSHFLNRSSPYFLIIVPIIAFFLGLLASLLSQSRGGWLFLPVMVVGCLVLYRSKLYSVVNVHKWLALFVFFLIFGLVWVLGGHVLGRVNLALDQLLLYLKYGDASSSIGIRIELWRVAISAISESPLLGIGIDNFHAYVKGLARAGLLEQSVVYQHAHNQFIHALVTTGIIGFSGLLAVFLVPVIVFFRTFQTSDSELRALSLAGLILVCGFIVFCLTDSLLFVPHTIKFYFFMLVAIGFFVSQREKQIELE